MSFPGFVAAQQAAIFAALGVDAAWSGIAEPVRVRVVERDVDIQIGQIPAVGRATFIKVRQSEVASPAKGAAVTTADQTFRILGKPRLDRKRVWTCEAEAL